MGFQSVEEVLSHVGGKVLVYGGQGTGKSTFSGTFPEINIVDTEDGQTYYLKKNKNIKGVMRTTSAAEVQETLDELNDEDAMKTFDTIVIDSGTKLYENMQSAAYEIVENRSRKQLRNPKNNKDIDMDDLNLAPRDWGHIKRWNQQLATAYILLSSMGKWVVVTSHQKDLMDENEPDWQKRRKIGDIPDLAKKAEHDYDIVLHMFTNETKDGEITYHARVLKDRTQVTKKGQTLDNPTFEIWREEWESTKNLGVKKVDLSHDLKKDVEKMQSEDDEVDNIVEEFKTNMKVIKNDTTKVAQVNKKIKELNTSETLINMKNLATSDIEALKSLNNLIKELL